MRLLLPIALLLLLGLPVIPGCASTVTVTDPLATLRAPDRGARAHRSALAELDTTPPSPEYVEALHRAVWRPGYTVEIREAAARRLADHDLPALKRTLRQQLPRMTAWAGRTRLCEMIAEEGWIDLTPALVSGWAVPVAAMPDEDRPEYKALVDLHGADQVDAVVFDLLVSARKVSEQGLRTRCWTLLHRLGGERDLTRLLEAETIDADDAFLLDLQAAARELGIVPANREEILWIRSLRRPEHADFWRQAAAALPRLTPDRRASMELRDVAVAVAAARHVPELLELSDAALYARVESAVRGQRHFSHGSNFGGQERRDRLYEWKRELTWGDLLAMTIAIEAMQVPEVVEHLLDFARRDQADRTTEYGGVLTLDDRGRFAVLEFPPRRREHDEKFIASQAMLDAAYTSLFHFHYHAQRNRNDRFAGPGFGDENYAENTRANCLVLTFVGPGVLNVDFYRHGRLQVDLGVVEGSAGVAGAS
ncbi:MAG: hypothetical protein HKO59_00035 [Phycisphaerales bacterium]|nr:hypothetical protein [Phycisphaerae bacterium]NNF45079.1 hypothetical protein [Phycisphaerales bacterium]NNM24370.1 hypothetical protein [Phycisphaerales bacterium]